MKNLTNNSLHAVRTLLLNGFIIILAFFMIQACDDDDDDNGPTGPNGGGNIAEVTQGNDDLSNFVSHLEDAELISTLEGDGPLTLFAPTNDAFDTLPEGFLADLSDEELNEVLSYHIAESDIASGDLEAEQTISTQAGSLYVTTENGDISINDSASVIEADIEASNGTIHTLDRVLRPDTHLDVVGVITKRYNLQAFQDSLVQAELADTLREDTETGYTVFAPTNTAFDNADLAGQDVENVLNYHVIPEALTSDNITAGEVETVNGETVEIEVSNGDITLTDQVGNTISVTTADLQGINGVVHITDGVLIPSTTEQE